MRVLVTGYGGFLGTAICRQLIQQGYQVRGLARQQYPGLTKLGVEPIQGDIQDSECLLAAVSGCDAVIHTAAKAGVWGSWQEYYSVNTLATQRLLEAAQQRGAGIFVYTSSPSVTFDGQAQSGVDESVPYPSRWLCNYPRSKAQAEQMVAQWGQIGKLLTCSLRPHLIWGAGDPHLFPRVVQRALKGQLRQVGSGQNLIDVVHVENAATAHLLALQRLAAGQEQLSGSTFFITDGQPVPCWQWITRILETAEVKVPGRSISFKNAYRLGGALELIYGCLRLKGEPPMTRFIAAQLALDHYFSIDHARQMLGYKPNIDTDRAMEQCRPWLKQIASC
jgi:nucleoside-diphosphate-sugar epimerase